METRLLVLVALLVLAIAFLGFLVRRGRPRERRVQGDHELRRRLDERLAESFTGERSHLSSPPSVREVRAIDGEPDRYVPVVRIDLGTTFAPGPALRFEFVAAVLETIHPTLSTAEIDVYRYDIEFAYGPDGLLVSGSCGRVSVPPSFAERLRSNDRYRLHELRRDVEAGERGRAGEDEPAPVAWGNC